MECLNGIETEIITCASKDVADIDKWISLLERKIILDEKNVKILCEKVKEIFVREKNVLQLNTPITVCGDIHGQYEDLVYIFQRCGELTRTKYLFLGDYIDRGRDGVECISLLFAYKIKYSRNLYLTRGNHECRSITTVYGFYDECQKKYGSSNAWKYYTEAFDCLPLCALVDGKIIAMHGGLSISSLFLDEINQLDRYKEIPSKGLMTDLLWSDPDEDEEKWRLSNRGAGIIFGPAVSEVYTYVNNLKFVCRAHQAVNDGYEWRHDKLCLTIFSAANYCNECGNLGAIFKLNRNSDKPILMQYSGQTYPNSSGSNKSDLTTYKTTYFPL